MLDAFIIEELKRREEARRREERRPTLEIPLDEEIPPGCNGDDSTEDDREENDRRVFIIDFGS